MVKKCCRKLTCFLTLYQWRSLLILEGNRLRSIYIAHIYTHAQFRLIVIYTLSNIYSHMWCKVSTSRPRPTLDFPHLLNSWNGMDLALNSNVDVNTWNPQPNHFEKKMCVFKKRTILNGQLSVKDISASCLMQQNHHQKLGQRMILPACLCG